MAAALHQQPGLARRDHRAAEIEAGDRARRTLADAIREADRHRRPVIALGQARGDQTEHARRPALADATSSSGAPRSSAGGDLRLGRRDQLALEPAPLFVQPLQPQRDLGHDLGRVAGQQLGGQMRAAGAAAGIEPRPQREGAVLGADGGQAMRAARASAASPGLPPRAATSQALRDQGPVEPDQRHHVADRAERDQIEPAAQVRLRPAHEMAARAQRAIERDHHEEGDPDRGQLADRADLVAPVRVDHAERLRQLRLGDVVIDHDDLLAPRGGARERLERGGAGSPSVTTSRQPLAARRSSACALGP